MSQIPFSGRDYVSCSFLSKWLVVKNFLPPIKLSRQDPATKWRWQTLPLLLAVFIFTFFVLTGHSWAANGESDKACELGSLFVEAPSWSQQGNTIKLILSRPGKDFRAKTIEVYFERLSAETNSQDTTKENAGNLSSKNKKVKTLENKEDNPPENGVNYPPENKEQTATDSDQNPQKKPQQCSPKDREKAFLVKNDWEKAFLVKVLKFEEASVTLQVVVPVWPSKTEFDNPLAPVMAKPTVTIYAVAKESETIVFAAKADYLVTGSLGPMIVGIIALILAGGLPAVFISKREQKPFKTSFLYIWEGKTGKASLSNFQIWLWTVIVFSLAVYLWWATGELFSFRGDVLWLLGIAGAGSVGARATAALRQEPGRLKAEEKEIAVKKDEANFGDLITTGGKFDLFKFQMLVFTLFTAGYVVVEVVTSLEFPVIPEGLFYLLGISNGSYVAAKAIKPNPFANFPAAQAELEALEIRLAEETKREEELDNQIKNKEKLKTASANTLSKLQTDLKEANASDSENPILITSLTTQIEKEQENLQRLDEGLAKLGAEKTDLVAKIEKLNQEKTAADKRYKSAEKAVENFVKN
ncbi:MAG: hypothetical protein IH995_07335 [Proteobacteria bacterium]|nr:hypothetical protein [Pseudomonadota bacterium]